jgi:HEAT repeat protein
MKSARFVVLACVAAVFAAGLWGCYSDEAGQKYVAKLDKKGGGKDAKHWVKKIGDPAQTSDAIKYLLELKDKSVVPDLLKLFDKDKAHRGDIAMVLAELGDKSIAPQLAAGVNLEISDNIGEQQVNDRANEKIALALAKLNDPSTKGIVAKLLDSKAANVMAAAVKAELVFKDPDAVPKLMEITKKDVLAKNIRADAVKVLGEIGDPRAVPALVRAMYIEKQGTIYPEASYALTQIGTPAVPDLIKTLERQNKEIEDIGKNFIVGAIEAKAADTLGWICDKSAYDPMAKLLQKYVKEGDNPIATAKVAFALARLQDLRAVGIISKFVEDEEDPSVRQHYTLALNILGDRSAVKALFKAVKKPDIEKYRKEGAVELEIRILRESRNDIVRAIGRLGTGAHLGDWDKMVKEEKDSDVKKVMDEWRPALGAAKDCSENLACWTGKLNDPNKIVREKAAYEIGRMGGDAGAEALVKLIDDKEQAVQYASLQGIYNLAEKHAAKILSYLETKEGTMDKAKKEKMAEDLKLLKLRLSKAAKK